MLTLHNDDARVVKFANIDGEEDGEHNGDE